MRCISFSGKGQSSERLWNTPSVWIDEKVSPTMTTQFIDALDCKMRSRFTANDMKAIDKAAMKLTRQKTKTPHSLQFSPSL